MISLKTLALATKQEVFDQVAHHLLTQNKRSVEWLACRYRSGNGLKCAAGCLISDDEYDPKLESMFWKELINDYFPHLINAHTDLITDLQTLHDEYEPAFWQEELKKIADLYKLTFNN